MKHITFSGGSNIGTSATSNTVTFAISDVVQLTASQTLTNKTFTSPTINTLTFASGTSTSGMNMVQMVLYSKVQLLTHMKQL